jgi:hypothetical protein
MKTPPDFVMYVVMVKRPGSEKFDPQWYPGSYYGGGPEAIGFQKRRTAQKSCKIFQCRYGKKNAYVQQYGPYS